MLLVQVSCLLQLILHLISSAAQILQLNCMLSLLCFKLLLNLFQTERFQMANKRQQLVKQRTTAMKLTLRQNHLHKCFVHAQGLAGSNWLVVYDKSMHGQTP